MAMINSQEDRKEAKVKGLLSSMEEITNAWNCIPDPKGMEEALYKITRIAERAIGTYGGE